MQIPGVLDDLYAGDGGEADLGADVARAASRRSRCGLRRPRTSTCWCGPGDSRRPSAWQRAAVRRRLDGRRARRPGPVRAYLYEVTVYAPTTDAVEVNRVTDPYSVALTARTRRTRCWSTWPTRRSGRASGRQAKPPVVAARGPDDLRAARARLLDQRRDGPGRRARAPTSRSPRDSAGTRHLRALAAAGLNTVHLLPTFDIATIQEDRAAAGDPGLRPRVVRAGLRRSSRPASPRSPTPTASTGATTRCTATTPEGSYAVDPDGAPASREFRTMVGALHADGLQVVLDEVFNHTSASGQAPAVGARPGGARLLPAARRDGRRRRRRRAARTSRPSTRWRRRLMVDSVVTWARDYKVDGFRFDLMGHHSKAEHGGRPGRAGRADAVEGRRRRDEDLPLRRGLELRRGGRTTPCSRRPRQGQLGGHRASARSPTGCATRSAAAARSTRTRASRASAPAAGTDPNGDAVNGTAADQLARAAHDADLVRLGLAGNLRDFAFLTSAGTVQTGRGDRLQRPAGRVRRLPGGGHHLRRRARQRDAVRLAARSSCRTDTPMADRVRMNTLSLATTALAQTPSFWHAGADLLRSKSLDRNSYNSGDWFNLLDCPARTTASAAVCPRRADNEAKWPFQQPLLADPALKPTPADIATASPGGGRPAAAAVLDAAVPARLRRPDRAEGRLPGLRARTPTPGVIVMTIDDEPAGTRRRSAGRRTWTGARRRPGRGQRLRRGDHADRRALAGHRLRPVAGPGDGRATRWSRPRPGTRRPARSRSRRARSRCSWSRPVTATGTAGGTPCRAGGGRSAAERTPREGPVTLRHGPARPSEYFVIDSQPKPISGLDGAR